MMYTKYWHERTIDGVRYQFEAQVDELDRYRINLYQQSFDGRWNTNFGAWQDPPRGETHQEALVSFADRWEAYTKMRPTSRTRVT